MKPVYIVYLVIGLLAVMFVYSQFFEEDRKISSQTEPIRDSLIVETYPELYRAIYSREASQLSAFLNHDSLIIRKQGWQALASTPVDSISYYLERALENELEEPWFALSMHEFTTEQLRSLEAYWLEEPTKRGGISRVLGRQGDEQTLDFLLNNMEEAADSTYEYDYALAVGRLSIDHKLGSDDQKKIIERAFLSDNATLICAYFYGFYRGEAQEEMPEEVKSMLYGLWKEYGSGNSTDVDQFITRILKRDVFYEITLYQNSEKELDQNIQLATELAQAVKYLKLEQRNILATRILLMHENPNVVQQTLASLTGRLSKTGNLYNFITSEIVADTSSDPFVWLQALEVTSAVNPQLVVEHSKRLDRITTDHPYYLSQVLRIWQWVDTPEGYLDRIADIIERGDTLRSFYAINELFRYWSNLDDLNDHMIEKTRDIVFNALTLGDRGVTYACEGLLDNDLLFNKDDFNRINEALSPFKLPEDIEVYQAFGTLYKERYEQQAKPAIDSLAALGYAPLNRSLNQAGWDVSIPEDTRAEFLKPNWERIWELGRKPTWVLETEKGIIKVQMNTLSAPATVSAIDSLTLAGAYDNIPFHRVVPNFVIQGGDIERQDGFGGPEFIIPTEASETEFKRSAAGIASAGTDTEGSQYFFMHQWKPHLNGRYTLFGNVVEGMDVVDRIVPGDSVLYAYWE